jgi:hypothetical protein
MKFRLFGWRKNSEKAINKGLALGVCLAVFSPNITFAQEANPFSVQAEQQFRNELDRYRTRSQNNTPPAGQNTPQRRRVEQDRVGQANSLFEDQFNQPLTSFDQAAGNRENRIEATSRDSEFRDNPFAARRGQDRFEPNGGELRNVDLTIERRQRRARRGANNRRNGQDEGQDRGLNQDTIEDQNAIAELEGRNGNNQQEGNADRFEEEFLAAERELEGDEQQARDINPRNRNLRQANNRQGQRGNRQRGQQARGRLNGNAQRNARGNARQQIAQNAAEQNFAENNDITGSIRNNDLEDTYAAEGKRVGSFLIFPEVTITGILSDNPTASVDNGPGDEAIEIVPNIVLQSDWARHSLQLQGQLRKSYYEELSSENIDEFLISATGRIDIQNNQFLELQARKEQTQDSRGDIDNLNSDAELANLDTLFLSALYEYQWNKTTMRLTGTVTEFDYEDVVDGLGNIINNDDQDYLETNLTARLSYTVHSGLYVYVEGNYIEREYESTLDDDGFQRGNDEQNYRVGLIHDLTSKIRFEASIGYQGLFADDARFIDVEDLVYEATLNYRPTRQTSLILSTSKSYDATDIAGTVAVEETNYSIALNHYFEPKILLNASLEHEEEIFEGINQSQKTLTAALTLQYIFNRHVRLIAGYEFTDVSTNDGADYQENQFRIGLNLRP